MDRRREWTVSSPPRPCPVSASPRVWLVSGRHPSDCFSFRRVLPQMQQSIRATRLAAGGCSNSAVERVAVASPVECAKLIWMDTNCGNRFHYDSANKVCSCLAPGTECAAESASVPSLSRYNASAHARPSIQCNDGYKLNGSFVATCTCDNPNDLCRSVANAYHVNNA